MRNTKKHPLLPAAILAATLALATISAGAQVRCNVTVNAQKIETTNREIFESLKNDIANFVNNRTWTNHTYKSHERIDCNFIVTLAESPAEGEYKGTMQVQALRPVYGSVYKSTTLNALDNEVEFAYKVNQPFDFSDNTHVDNLTSLLAYWIYIVLGIDYDTFAPQGGTEWFKLAERVVQNAQSESRAGWSSSGGLSRRNRYWLVENILGGKYAEERAAFYLYHRLGLDAMGTSPDEARTQVMQALQGMQKIYTTKPDNTLFFYIMFFDAKADEIVNIFSEATPKEKQDAYQLLSVINIINEPKYKKLK
ncbi:MAG: DUF4835 family protein [Prevotellaceae bacterium]|jgi:hypothetical protein|nr:DUF4835 family protein [Prevotellaceae bacterium]